MTTTPERTLQGTEPKLVEAARVLFGLLPVEARRAGVSYLCALMDQPDVDLGAVRVPGAGRVSRTPRAPLTPEQDAARAERAAERDRKDKARAEREAASAKAAAQRAERLATEQAEEEAEEEAQRRAWATEREREAAEDKAKTDGVINAWTGDLKRIADALDTRRRYKLARAASPVMGTISLPPRGLRRGGNTMPLTTFIKHCLECPDEKALHEWFDNVFPEHV